MADDTETTPKKADEPRYTVARLLEDAWDFLGCERHVAVGGLYGLSDDKELTVSQAKARVEKYLATPAETDNATPVGA